MITFFPLVQVQISPCGVRYVSFPTSMLFNRCYDDTVKFICFVYIYRKTATNRKSLGKNQVYNIRELLDIQMKTRRKHVAKAEEEKTPKQDRKLSVDRKLSLGGTGVSCSFKLLLVITVD